MRLHCVSRVMHIFPGRNFQKRFGSDLHLLIFATRFEIQHLKTTGNRLVLYRQDRQIPQKSRKEVGSKTLKKAKEKFGVNNTRRIFAVRSKIFDQFFKILHTVFTSSVNN